MPTPQPTYHVILKPINHGKHAFWTFMTGGMWGIVWLCIWLGRKTTR